MKKTLIALLIALFALCVFVSCDDTPKAPTSIEDVKTYNEKTRFVSEVFGDVSYFLNIVRLRYNNGYTNNDYITYNKEIITGENPSHCIELSFNNYSGTFKYYDKDELKEFDVEANGTFSNTSTISTTQDNIKVNTTKELYNLNISLGDDIYTIKGDVTYERLQDADLNTTSMNHKFSIIINGNEHNIDCVETVKTNLKEPQRKEVTINGIVDGMNVSISDIYEDTVTTLEGTPKTLSEFDDIFNEFFESPVRLIYNVIEQLSLTESDLITVEFNENGYGVSFNKFEDLIEIKGLGETNVKVNGSYKWINDTKTDEYYNYTDEYDLEITIGSDTFIVKGSYSEEGSYNEENNQSINTRTIKDFSITINGKEYRFDLIKKTTTYNGTKTEFYVKGFYNGEEIEFYEESYDPILPELIDKIPN